MSNPTQYSTAFLISVLDSARIPTHRPSGQIVQTAFRAKDGWEVHVDWSYDDSFAVIDHLLSPEGETIDPYEWPCEQEGGDGDFERIDEWEPKPVDPLAVLMDAAYQAHHELAKLGFYDHAIIARLIQVAESAGLTFESPHDPEEGVVWSEHAAVDGWKVGVNWHSGDDCFVEIESFTHPDGLEISREQIVGLGSDELSNWSPSA